MNSQDISRVSEAGSDRESLVSAGAEHSRMMKKRNRQSPRTSQLLGISSSHSRHAYERRHRRIFGDKQIMQFWVPPLSEYKAEISMSHRSNVSSKESLDLSFHEEFQPPPIQETKELPVLRRQSTIKMIMNPQGRWTIVVLCFTVASILAYITYLLIK